MAFKGKVAVLMGGVGSEREVSLQSGRNVVSALASAGINSAGIDITPDNLSILDDRSIDVFFIMLHGKWGEDGQLQQVMEDKGLTFTGSGSKASELSFDKILSKELYRSCSLPTADWITVDKPFDREYIERQLPHLGSTMVVKPACEGSSTGVEIVEGENNAICAAEKCFRKYGKTLIEQFIKGREFTVGILEGSALPLIEICPKEKFYDFNAKYISDATEYLFDTLTDSSLIAAIQDCAVKCFNAAGCRGFARVDFLLDEDNNFYILETNTIPGFTSHSLLPKAAQKQGLSQGQLCVKIIESALRC
jgi:D-alanine-D-alanine ligase